MMISVLYSNRDMVWNWLEVAAARILFMSQITSNPGAILAVAEVYAQANMAA